MKLLLYMILWMHVIINLSKLIECTQRVNANVNYGLSVIVMSV